jgi:multidrug transporter EmrE-like cation transporter
MTKHAIALVVALLLNAAANLMIKFGMRDLDASLGGAGLFDGGLLGLAGLLLKHWILLLGLACFAANVVFYAFALQKLPISVAYPIMATCGFAVIVTVAGLLLKERLSLSQWVGVAAILIGVVLVAKDAGRQLSAPPAPTAAAASTNEAGK